MNLFRVFFHGCLFVTSYVQISGKLKSLQIVASLTAERDNETRKAALNTLATGYKILGILYPEDLL